MRSSLREGNRMNNPIEIEDHTRVDKFMQARRRAMVMGQIWKPMGMGAVGAALVISAVWVILPKISYREVVVPSISLKPITVPDVTMKPITVPEITLKPVALPLPQTTPTPTPPPVAADAPKTLAEQKFLNRPEYKAALYHGRIVKSIDGKALSFADGNNYWPALWDALEHDWATNTSDINKKFVTDPFIGDLAACAHLPGRNDLVVCHALHNGEEVNIVTQPLLNGVPI